MRRETAGPGFVCSLLIAPLIGPVIAGGTPEPSSSDRKAVLQIVQSFFDAMTARDAEGAGKLMIPDGTFHRVQVEAGQAVLRTFTDQSYLEELPATKERMRERILNPEVRVHGSIATVWAPYDFWRDGKLSHCGVDAFDLVKTGAGWKIGGGSYTVEHDCEPSPLGPLED